MRDNDDFSSYHRELLEGRYDSVDRIVLNGYFPMGQQGGGFRTWWRQLTGSDETLDQDHLLRLAGRFGRRLHAYASATGIPLIHCGVTQHSNTKCIAPRKLSLLPFEPAQQHVVFKIALSAMPFGN